MSILLIGIAAAAGAAGLVYFLRKAPNPDLEFSTLKHLASSHDITMDKAFVWRNKGMAINKAAGKLLYVENSEGKVAAKVIDITNLKTCEIVKRYSHSANTPGGSSAKRLASIDLELQVAQGDANEWVFRFYNEKYDKVSDMKMLFQKAWHWKRMLLR